MKERNPCPYRRVPPYSQPVGGRPFPHPEQHDQGIQFLQHFWFLSVNLSHVALTQLEDLVQLCGVEQTVPSVRWPLALELILRQAQCNKADIPIGLYACRRFIEKFDLDYAGNDHNAHSLVDVPNMLDEGNNGLATVHNRVHKKNSAPAFDFLLLEILWLVCMDEHGSWKGLADAQSHRLASAHQCNNSRVVFIEESVSLSPVFLNVRNFSFFAADHL